MFVSDGLGVNESGHLTVGGCDTVSLAKKYGTPYMCYDENMIRKNCREFVKSMEENYDGNGLVCYASKAFSCLEMCRICKEEKMGLDVVSGGEFLPPLRPASRQNVFVSTATIRLMMSLQWLLTIMSAE